MSGKQSASSRTWHTHLGLTLPWRIIGWAELLDRLDQEAPDIFQMGWMADYLDHDNFLWVSFHDRWADWRNETYVELIERARQITDQAGRLRLYQQADSLLVKEAPIIPLTYPRQHLLVKPWVTQFPSSALKSWYWKDVVIEPH